MNRFLNKHKRAITRQILFVFVMSWFSLIGQASAHTFMLAEMQQHKNMGHDMASHCPPVLCETVIALDDQSGHGAHSLQLLDLNAIPAIRSFQITTYVERSTRLPRTSLPAEAESPPLLKSRNLRI